ncbi:MAG: hypothetical protein K1X81_01100 [Bacteroidia bacterium]|nr:hypothetical protein [Bacteroidia bacterium]
MRLIYLLFFVLLGAGEHVWACDCELVMGKQSAGVIATGQVTAVRKFKNGYQVRFAADSIFKGVVKKNLVIKTPSLNKCGFLFKKGARYIVYAQRRSGRAILVTACSFSRQISPHLKVTTFYLQDDKKN